MSSLIDLDANDPDLLEKLAHITYDSFQEHAPSWLPTLARAREELIEACGPGHLGRVLLHEGQPAGWIGVIPGRCVWEIHPIAVAIEQQGKGFGGALVEDVARIAANAGALSVFAGTSDETGTTNLFGADLYKDPIESLRNLRTTGRSPVVFWQKVGFSVVGLMPDEEGLGKPGIYLAKRL